MSLKKYIFLSLLLNSMVGFSQTKVIDSLHEVISTTSDIKEKVDTYGRLSWKLIDSDLTKAIRLNDSAFAIAQQINYEEGIAEAHYKYSVLNRAKGNYDKALNHLNEFEDYVFSKKDTLKLANIAFQKGVLNCIKGDYGKGLEYYQQCIERYESINHKRGLGITYNTIGITYSNMTKNREAIKSFEHSIKYLSEVNDNDALASSYHNLGGAYNNIDEDEKAIEYFKKSMELSEKSLNVRRIAQSNSNIASILIESGEHNQALKYARKAYEIQSKKGYKGELTNSAVNLAKILMHLGKFRESEKIFNNTIENFKGSLKDKANLYRGMAVLKEKIGEYKSALNYYKESRVASDSILNEKNIKNTTELQLKFETEKKDKELANQQLEIEKKQTQNKLMTGLIIFLLLASILTWFVFQQRQKRKNQEILVLKREQQVKTLELLMEGEEKERFRIAKELHDGVNVDLSAIKYKLTSLLEKNNEVINEAVAMIDKSCEQVRAISHNLVPPSLKDFSLVDAIEDYCSTMNNLHNPEIVFNTIGNPIAIPKKAEINIFRIVQELVNNSVKHAEATEVDVQLSFQSNNIQLTIEDNGKGFNKDVVSKGIGLQNIKSRVDYLQAKLDFRSDNNGTFYVIDIKIDE